MDVDELDIIFEDKYFVAVNKPAGALFDWAIAIRPELMTVHRLDKDTSGVILFAKSQEVVDYFKSLGSPCTCLCASRRCRSKWPNSSVRQPDVSYEIPVSRHKNQWRSLDTPRLPANERISRFRADRILWASYKKSCSKISVRERPH